MPGFNQKGPMGQGSMTGRKMGRCTNFGAGLKNQISESKQAVAENLPENFQGRGLGQGHGRGGVGRGLGKQHRFRGDL
jgi:hypothetical protein